MVRRLTPSIVLQIDRSLNRPNAFIRERFIYNAFCGCSRCGTPVWLPPRTLRLKRIPIRRGSRPLDGI